MIIFNATARRATCLTDDPITTGSVGIPVHFAFSNDWEGLTKIAVFRAGEVSVDVLLSENACTVPPEVLEKSGEDLIIGLYGTSGDGTTVIPTVYACAGCIFRGTEPSGVDPAPQTPSLIDQLVAAVEPFVITLTASGNVTTADKSGEEILSAIADRRRIIARTVNGNSVTQFEITYTHATGTVALLTGIWVDLDSSSRSCLNIAVYGPLVLAGTQFEPIHELPDVNASDNGKVLRVVNGRWAAVEV